MIIREKIQFRNDGSNSGFTLLELLLVIAIIGILAGFALPAISKIRTRGRIAAVKVQLEKIETALDTYYAEYDTYPPMGNDWLGVHFFPSEDVGLDGEGPFTRSGSAWVANVAYPGPDTDGTEGNYTLDGGQGGPEDQGVWPFVGATANNNRLDGTYYDRLGMFSTADIAALDDIFAAGGTPTYYHYYAGYVSGTTSLGMPKYRRWTDNNKATGALDEYADRPPPYYNRWVLYSVGLDGKDHGLHNYYLAMQDGEDVGEDAFASDVSDDDGDFILFEPSTQENDGSNDKLTTVTVRETGWTTPGTGSEQAAPAGNSSALEGMRGKPVFSYDVRLERRREGAVYAMPDGDGAAWGVIMRYGP